MPTKPLKRLPPEIEEEAYSMILNGKTLDSIAVAIGLKTRRNFQLYQMQFPEFQELIQRALIAECIYLEEEMRHVADKYNKDYARVQIEALSRILKYRDPRRYGDKVNVEMNMTVDIAGALERAERRVIEITPTNVLPILGTKKTENNE